MVLSFITSAWGPCSATCGVSVRSRSVHCRVFVVDTASVHDLPDSSCPGRGTPTYLNFTARSVLFFSRPRSEGWPHHERTSFISVLCHFHGESCPRLDVVHPGRAWPSSPTCTCHCSLHYLFLQATPLFPHGVTTVYASYLDLTVSNSFLFTPALLRTHSFETRRIFLSSFVSKAS